MRYISATEAKQGLAALIDAAQQEPVTIQRQNLDVAVILSAEEYDRLRAINLRELDRLCESVSATAKARGLTETKLAEILAEER